MKVKIKVGREFEEKKIEVEINRGDTVRVECGRVEVVSLRPFRVLRYQGDKFWECDCSPKFFARMKREEEFQKSQPF